MGKQQFGSEQKASSAVVARFAPAQGMAPPAMAMAAKTK